MQTHLAYDHQGKRESLAYCQPLVKGIDGDNDDDNNDDDDDDVDDGIIMKVTMIMTTMMITITITIISVAFDQIYRRIKFENYVSQQNFRPSHVPLCSIHFCLFNAARVEKPLYTLAVIWSCTRTK